MATAAPAQTAPAPAKAASARSETANPFAPIEFWNPTRKNLRIAVPRSRGKFLQFINGRYLAVTPAEAELVRRACAGEAFETDLPEDMPDLEVAGWRCRSHRAAAAELARLGRG